MNNFLQILPKDFQHMHHQKFISTVKRILMQTESIIKFAHPCTVCLEFTNKKSCSFYLFELVIIGIHIVSHLADQYSIHKVINDVKN